MAAFPILPNDWKPNYIYLRGGKFIAVVITEEHVDEFAWDGVSTSFLEHYSYPIYK